MYLSHGTYPSIDQLDPTVVSVSGIENDECGCVNISEVLLSVLWVLYLFKRVLLHPMEEEVHFRVCRVLKNTEKVYSKAANILRLIILQSSS